MIAVPPASDASAFSEGRDLLFTLFLKVSWAAALAALLVRFSSFRKLVFTENRGSDQKVMLLLFLDASSGRRRSSADFRLPILRPDARRLVLDGADWRPEWWDFLADL